MNILYLDYDGVLHPDRVYFERGRGVYLKDGLGHEVFEHATVLEELLAPHLEWTIVLSTNWVPHLGFETARDYLPPGLRSRVVGATFDAATMHKEAFLMLPRAAQVLDDLESRKPEEWLAIDDAGESWPSGQQHRLLLTDGYAGLGEAESLDRLRLALGRRLDAK